MCLILVAWHARAGFPLVVAANRDELHARPALAADFWKDRPGILGGRDLEAGGSWMGMARSGRFAAVTNYRGGRDPAARESRGALVTGFLSGNASASAYVNEVGKSKDGYSGFNFLAADRDELWWLSNRGGEARRLEPGIHALGNLLLDTPELAGVKAEFARVLESSVAPEPLFGVLESAKIVAPEYGTRCATVLVRNAAGGALYAERAFDREGAAGQTARFEFACAT
jgi:uncharacterized protein with NRDE domain